MDDFLIVLVPESVLQISCEAAKVASIAVSQIEAGTSLSPSLLVRRNSGLTPGSFPSRPPPSHCGFQQKYSGQ